MTNAGFNYFAPHLDRFSQLELMVGGMLMLGAFISSRVYILLS